jgi:hypothetical protein
MHAGTAGTWERGRLAHVAKSRAEALDLLASLLPKGDALLHRGRHGTGELGFVTHQGSKPVATAMRYFAIGFAACPAPARGARRCAPPGGEPLGRAAVVRWGRAPHALWIHSKCISSVGAVTLEVVQRYIISQKGV